MPDTALVTAIAQGNPDTEASLQRILEACNGNPKLEGAALAKICNHLDPSEIDKVQDLEEDIIDTLEEHHD